jgi:hypothetical protein
LDSGSFGLGPFEDFWKKYDIPKPHVCDLGPGLEVYYEDKAMPISRYPKTDFMHIKNALGKTAIYHLKVNQNGSEEGVFTCDDEIVKNWGEEKDLLLVGYWYNDWATQRHTIKKLDTETGIIEVNEPYHIYGYRDGPTWYNEPNGGHFYAINVFSELKNPGEWCINRAEGKLYVIPYENQEYINISVCEDIFLIDSRNNIEIKNIIFEQCRKTGVMVTNSRDIKVDNCIVKNVGAWGLLGENCNNTAFTNCLVHNTGGGGIGLSGGDRNTLTSSENKIINNTIHDVARWHKMCLPAIEITGVGGLVAENIMYDLPHIALMFQGNNHIIEKNEMYNACYEANDAGVVYCGRDYSCRGNIIRYNNIHDCTGFESRGCNGLYFDDGMSSAEVYGNVITNLQIGILLAGGRDFKIYDNTLFDCDISLFMDERCETWAETLRDRLKQRLSEVDYTNEIWQKAYPELVNFFEQNWRMPENNIFENNTMIGGHGVVLDGRDILECSNLTNNTYIPMSRETAILEHQKEFVFYNRENNDFM